MRQAQLGLLGDNVRAVELVCGGGDAQRDAGEKEEAAAGLVDHQAEALLLEARPTAEEAAACCKSGCPW